MDSEFERTLENIEKCGRAKKDIRWVINTHCHTDHSLSDRKFHEIGAQIIIHEADAAAIEKGTLVTLFGRYKLTEFPQCPVDRRLSDGEELRLGDKVFVVIHTPATRPAPHRSCYRRRERTCCSLKTPYSMTPCWASNCISTRITVNTLPRSPNSSFSH